MHNASLVSIEAYSVITTVSLTQKMRGEQMRNGEFTLYLSCPNEDNPVSFLPTQLGQSSDDAVSVSVLRVFIQV